MIIPRNFPAKKVKSTRKRFVDVVHLFEKSKNRPFD